MSLGIKSSAFLRVEETEARKFEVRADMWFLNIKFIKIKDFFLKWVHMARYEFILRQGEAIWLRIISRPLLTPQGAIEDPKNPKKKNT